MYAVQKKVPLPKVTKLNPVGRRKYPFEELAVGEFFFIPDRAKNNMSAHASNTGKQLGAKFATRLIHMKDMGEGAWVPCDKGDEAANLGIGVWRTE